MSLPLTKAAISADFLPPWLKRCCMPSVWSWHTKWGKNTFFLEVSAHCPDQVPPRTLLGWAGRCRELPLSPFLELAPSTAGCHVKGSTDRFCFRESPSSSWQMTGECNADAKSAALGCTYEAAAEMLGSPAGGKGPWELSLSCSDLKGGLGNFSTGLFPMHACAHWFLVPAVHQRAAGPRALVCICVLWLMHPQYGRDHLFTRGTRGPWEQVATAGLFMNTGVITRGWLMSTVVLHAH